MKRVLITALAVVSGAGVLAAQPAKFNKEERRKEFTEMNNLVESYKKEKSKKKKAAIEEQVKEKVSANYDKHIKFLEKMVADSEKRLAKAKEKLAKANEPEAKAKHVEEVSKKILSGEKPTLFAPPFHGKGGKAFGKHMRGKGPRHQDQGGCPCMNRPHDADGELPPPPPPFEEPEAQEPAPAK